MKKVKINYQGHLVNEAEKKLGCPIYGAGHICNNLCAWFSVQDCRVLDDDYYKHEQKPSTVKVVTCAGCPKPIGELVESEVSDENK